MANFWTLCVHSAHTRSWRGKVFLVSVGLDCVRIISPFFQAHSCYSLQVTHTINNWKMYKVGSFLKFYLIINLNTSIPAAKPSDASLVAAYIYMLWMDKVTCVNWQCTKSSRLLFSLLHLQSWCYAIFQPLSTNFFQLHGSVRFSFSVNTSPIFHCVNELVVYYVPNCIFLEIVCVYGRSQSSLHCMVLSI